MPASPARRFTYGDQFDEKKTPLLGLLGLCVEQEPSRANLQEAVRSQYFPGHGNSDNSGKMAMNCILSLNAYGLIKFTDKGKQYDVTDLSHELIELAAEDGDEPGDGEARVFRRFATHILTNLGGLTLLRLIENIRTRGEQVTLEYVGEELTDLGIKCPPSSTYVSTMTSWLGKANVFRPTGWDINWDVVYDLLNLSGDEINSLYKLDLEQKYFLLSLVSLGGTEFVASNGVANHTRSVYSIRLTSKNLVKDVIEPLEERGLIESQKTTAGRGAKPHDVRLTERGRNEVLVPLLESISQVAEYTTVDLNRTFEDVAGGLNALDEAGKVDKHVRGVALELFAIWIIRLLGLRFSKWRLRSYEATGGGEVDVMAASDKIVYSRWQIQCKNVQGTVSVETIQKEVGATFLTHADVVMVVTTGTFSSDAHNYASLVTDTSRYYIILLDGNDLQRIIQDRTLIVEILNVKARRVFAKKELGIIEMEDEADQDDELEIGTEIAQAAEGLFAVPPVAEDE